MNDGFEEESMRQPVEEHQEFYEGDTDDEREECFKIPEQDVENAQGSESDIPETYPDKKKEAQSCLTQLTVCNKYRHVNEFFGKRLFELFKVQIIRLDGSSSDGGSSFLEGPLFGAIVFETDEDPELIIPYYNDSIALKLEPGKIVNLPLSGLKPGLVPMTDFSRWVKLTFKFQFNDYKLNDHAILTPDHMSWHRNFDCSPAISRELLFGNPNTDPFLMAATFGIYDGALATVSVKIMKRGVRSCSGFVFARSCIFITRIRLLSLEKDEKRELVDGSECGGCVKLTRSIIAVPSYSSLIIAAVLYDQDGKEIGHGRTSFRAKPSGTDSDVVGNDNNIHIGVNWECDGAISLC